MWRILPDRHFERKEAGLLAECPLASSGDSAGSNRDSGWITGHTEVIHMTD
jgi:hypothetical protein